MQVDTYRDTLAQQLRDPERLRAVRSVQEDEQWRTRAKTIASLAAQMLKTEIAEVNLVTDREMHCIASADDDERSVAVERSYCQHVVGTGGAVVVYESREHALVRDSPTAERLHCYLGIPLTHRGQVLGALCVAGSEPRDWTELEIMLLTELTEALLAEAGWISRV